MNKNRKEPLLATIDKILADRLANHQRVASDVRDMRDATRSQKGDRLLAMTQENLSRQAIDALQVLRQEIVDSSNQRRKAAIPPVYVQVRYNGDSGDESFYFVNNPATVEGYVFVTPKSPLGRSIFGKKVNETFNYEIQSFDLEVSGRIQRIE